MVNERYVNFLVVIGEEYIKAVCKLAIFGPDLLDGYRIFSTAFGADGITPGKLQAATDDEIDLLTASARKLNGSDQIRSNHIREVIRQALARWSAPP
jgi:hypothetical protein